jgi:hypothetical protein
VKRRLLGRQRRYCEDVMRCEPRALVCDSREGTHDVGYGALCCVYQSVLREEARWAKMEDERRLEEEHWNDVRTTGSQAKTNKGSAPYNPITLKYNDDLDGLRLRWVLCFCVASVVVLVASATCVCAANRTMR